MYILQAGKLIVEPFTHQTECKLSQPNICKGKILDEYILSRKQDGVNFSPIVYAGTDLFKMRRILNFTVHSNLSIGLFGNISFTISFH